MRRSMLPVSSWKSIRAGSWDTLAYIQVQTIRHADLHLFPDPWPFPDRHSSSHIPHALPSHNRAGDDLSDRGRGRNSGNRFTIKMQRKLVVLFLALMLVFAGLSALLISFRSTLLVILVYSSSFASFRLFSSFSSLAICFTRAFPGADACLCRTQCAAVSDYERQRRRV